MPRYASLADLQDRYPTPISDDLASYAETLLFDSFDVIGNQVPGLVARIATDTDGSLVRAIVRVQCAMVARVLSNPNGYLSETIDDYTYRRDSAVSAGKLYVAEDELDSLRVTRAIRTAFSIRPS